MTLAVQERMTAGGQQQSGRIVSLLPSATEIVCALGLGDRLVGVTHECDWPPFVRALPKLTSSRIPKGASQRTIDRAVKAELDQGAGLYDLDEDALAALEPDLVVTQALCAVCAVSIETVTDAVCRMPNTARIVNLEPHCLADVWETIRLVAQAAGVPERGRKLVAEIARRIATVERAVAARTTTPSLVLLEWLDPPFACGHWTPEIVTRAGGRELLGRAGAPSYEVDLDVLLAADPEILVIACCGRDLARTRHEATAWLTQRPALHRLRAVSTGRVFLVDGNAYFSRPGPRLVDSIEMLAAILHPEHVSWPETAAPALRRTAEGTLVPFPA